MIPRAQAIPYMCLSNSSNIAKVFTSRQEYMYTNSYECKGWIIQEYIIPDIRI